MSEQATALAADPTITAPPTIDPAAPPNTLDSDRWAAIAKKEQRAVHRELEIKKREEALGLKEKELQTKLTPFQEFELQRQKDPVAALRGLGFSETDIFNWLAQSEKKEPTPEERAQQIAAAEVDKYKKEQEEKSSKESKERDEQILTRFKGRIKGFLSANKDKYEACADYGSIAEDSAYKLIEQIAKDTGEVVTLDEAFQALESFYDGEYERMSKYNKFKKVEGEEPLIAQTKKEEIVSRGTPTKTITNAATQTIASTVKRTETRDQKRERLINQIKQTGLHK